MKFGTKIHLGVENSNLLRSHSKINLRTISGEFEDFQP